MEDELRRKIILEHYQHPKNKGLIDDSTYLYSNTNNESCIDEVNLMLKIKDNNIMDIRFDGDACAICTSSTSIMIETLIGKTVEEAYEIYQNFVDMVEGKNYNVQKLENAIVYNNINKQPSRKKCALLPWLGIKKILDRHEKKV